MENGQVSRPQGWTAQVTADAVVISFALADALERAAYTPDGHTPGDLGWEELAQDLADRAPRPGPELAALLADQELITRQLAQLFAAYLRDRHHHHRRRLLEAPLE